MDTKYNKTMKYKNTYRQKQQQNSMYTSKIYEYKKIKTMKYTQSNSYCVTLT